MVELQPSKLDVASSNLVSRSSLSQKSSYPHAWDDLAGLLLLNPFFKTGSRGVIKNAHVAQSVERFLGKEEVHRFNPGRGLHFFKIVKCIRDSWRILFVAFLKMREYKHNNGLGLCLN